MYRGVFLKRLKSSCSSCIIFASLLVTCSFNPAVSITAASARYVATSLPCFTSNWILSCIAPRVTLPLEPFLLPASFLFPEALDLLEKDEMAVDTRWLPFPGDKAQ